MKLSQVVNCIESTGEIKEHDPLKGCLLCPDESGPVEVSR